MSFEKEGGPGLAVVIGEQAVDTAALGSDAPATMEALLAADDATMSRLAAAAAAAPATARRPRDEFRPAMPIARPGKILCMGLNYAEHAKEGGNAVPAYPALFMRTQTSMLAAGAPVVRPNCSEQLDYEAELMVIVGRTARHVAAEHALDHVFGYTLFNDVSVRDYQRRGAQWTPGKNFDATGPVGPVVVTPDELPPGAAGLRIQSRLNGQVMQDGTTADMLFPVARMIEILSEFTTLEPGDMIATGTPAGVGHARRPPVWMRPGDVVEIEIEGIGVLRNPIVDETAATATRAASVDGGRHHAAT